jgi:hypothetical protein
MTHREVDVSVHQAMARCLFRKVVIASGYDGATASGCPESIRRIPAFQLWTPAKKGYKASGRN